MELEVARHDLLEPKSDPVLHQDARARPDRVPALLEDRLHVLGADHPDTATARNHLALTLEAQGVSRSRKATGTNGLQRVFVAACPMSRAHCA